ncbi:MAG: ATP-binding protein [Propionibacteriaceae bacterium]|nr:ATP-binding protein [Propionibacteriaceae bacterium]
MIEALPDIPRQLTAIAEWLACGVYLVWRLRFAWLRTVLVLAVGLGLLSLVQQLAGRLPLALWVPGMVLAVGAMYALVMTGAKVSFKTAGYLTARAFVLAELMAALHWQIHCWFFLDKDVALVWQVGLGVLVYGGVGAVASLLEAYQARDRQSYVATRRDLFWAAAIAVSTFCMSNLSFMSTATPFSSRLGPEVFYIRTLVDLCGLVALYAQHEQRLQARARAEIAAIEQLMRSQHDQYLVSERTIDSVQRAYHDLKHQIQVIRAEPDPARRTSHLDDLEGSIKDYEALTRTGNSVLDIVLTSKGLECVEHSIALTTVADGSVLAFLAPADLATLFGNALDNAIAATARLGDPDERLIKLALFAQAGFAVVTVENSFTGELKMEEGAIVTLHQDRDRHGYGLKSIRFVAEKYGGTMTAHAEDNWFLLRVLLPLPRT